MMTLLWPIVLLAAQPGAEAIQLKYIDPPSAAGAMAPNLSLRGSNAILSWVEPFDGGARVRVSKLSADRWSTPETIVENERVLANWADVPSVTALDDRKWLAHWAEKSGKEKYAYDVMLALRDRGRWRGIASPHDDGTPTEHGFVSILPEANVFRIFWLDGRNMAGHDSGSMTLRSGLLRQERVTSSIVADDRTCECCSTSAAMTAAGPIIAYRDRSAGEIRDVAVVRWNGRAFSAPKIVHADGWKMPGCPVNGPAIDADQRKVAVAWFTGAGSVEIRVAFSSDGGESFGPAIRVDPEAQKPPIGRADVILDGESAIVSWIASDGASGAEIVARRVSLAGTLGARGRIAATDPARASGFPRMIRAGKEAFFAWTEVGPPSRIRVARASLSEIGGSSPARSNKEQPSAAAEPYTALDFEGRAVSLAQLSGKVVVINLWATWCKPCREEMPALAELHREYQAHGVEVVGISVDDAGLGDQIRRAATELGASYPIWLDPMDKASSYFAAAGLPATFLLGRDGKMRARHLGALGSDWKRLRSEIDAALAEK